MAREGSLSISMRPGITPLVSADSRLAIEVVLDEQKYKKPKRKLGTFDVYLTSCKHYSPRGNR